MNKFYTYLLPVVLLIISFVTSTFFNNEFILYIGWVISLILMNKIAHSYQNKIVKKIILALFVLTVICTIGLLLWASAWSSTYPSPSSGTVIPDIDCEKEKNRVACGYSLEER
jgi:hypothetical protein